LLFLREKVLKISLAPGHRVDYKCLIEFGRGYLGNESVEMSVPLGIARLSVPDGMHLGDRAKTAARLATVFSVR
jgi:hypothetical protein